CILLRPAHVALRINIIIISPVSNGCNRYGCFENICSLHDTNAAHEASKAPAPDADPVTIYVGQACQVTCDGYLIIAFQLPQLEIGFFLKSFSSSTGTGTVSTNDHVAFLRHHLMPEVVPYREIIFDFL